MRGESIYLEAMSVFDQLLTNRKADRKLLSDDEVTATYKKHLKLIRKAAHLGHDKAQWRLGQHYEDFNFLAFDNPEYNPKKCVLWYTKACDQGNGDACNNLADKYENGEGCEQNIKKALELYKKAADLGNDLGKKNYRIMLKDLKRGKYKLEE
jgi:TPR repeat protein